MKTDEIDQYYATRWSEMDDFRPYTSPAKSRRLSLIAQYLERYGPDVLKRLTPHMLDYGCGSGWLLPFLKFYGFDPIYAYDITPKVLATVRIKYPWAKVMSGNLEFPSPLPSESFSLVTSIEVLEHVPYHLKNEYFQDIYRVTKPGGVVIVTTPNAFWRSILPKESEQPVEDWVSVSEFKLLALKNGFKILDLSTRGIDNYRSLGNQMILSNSIKYLLSKMGLWKAYVEKLEKIGRGITIHGMLQRASFEG